MAERMIFLMLCGTLVLWSARQWKECRGWGGSLLKQLGCRAKSFLLYPEPTPLQPPQPRSHCHTKVLFEGVGLLRQESLELGLAKIVEAMELKGWAACELGLHGCLVKLQKNFLFPKAFEKNPAKAASSSLGRGKLLERALLEAKKMKLRMSPGSTVIENRIVDPQESPNAERGDRILFMQEQGLSGAKAAKGQEEKQEKARVASFI